MVQDKYLLQKEKGESPHSKVNGQGITEYHLLLGEVSVTALLSTRAYFFSHEPRFKGVAKCSVERSPNKAVLTHPSI